MDRSLTKDQMWKDGKYGEAWLHLELLMFFLLNIFTLGIVPIYYNMWSDTTARPQPRFPWERLNNEGCVLYYSTLPGRWELVKGLLHRKVA